MEWRVKYFTIDHTSYSRRITVLTPDGDISSIWDASLSRFSNTLYAKTLLHILPLSFLVKWWVGEGHTRGVVFAVVYGRVPCSSNWSILRIGYGWSGVLDSQ